MMRSNSESRRPSEEKPGGEVRVDDACAALSFQSVLIVLGDETVEGDDILPAEAARCRKSREANVFPSRAWSPRAATYSSRVVEVLARGSPSGKPRSAGLSVCEEVTSMLRIVRDGSQRPHGCPPRLRVPAAASVARTVDDPQLRASPDAPGRWHRATPRRAEGLVLRNQ